MTFLGINSEDNDVIIKAFSFLTTEQNLTSNFRESYVIEPGLLKQIDQD